MKNFIELRMDGLPVMINTKQVCAISPTEEGKTIVVFANTTGDAALTYILDDEYEKVKRIIIPQN